MIEKMSDEDLQVASYRLALENHVMLKMLLGTNAAIMRALNLPVDFSPEILATHLPGYKPEKPDLELRKMFQMVGPFADRESIICWDYAFTVKRIKKEIEKDPDLGIKID